MSISGRNKKTITYVAYMVAMLLCIASDIINIVIRGPGSFAIISLVVCTVALVWNSISLGSHLER